MEESRHIVEVSVGSVSEQYEALNIEVSRNTLAQEIVGCIVERLGLNNPLSYFLSEAVYNLENGDLLKEKRIGMNTAPVSLQNLWLKKSVSDNSVNHDKLEYRFCLRDAHYSIAGEPAHLDSEVIKDYYQLFLYSQPKDKEYPDLCLLNNLTEEALLQNLKVRFNNGQIYTYVGSILISVNPFKYYPIYNPKYVKLYQNHRLGELPPHIFAIADCAYHTMVKQRRDQCIVISGESGSGKTESTLFLLHHLTMLSQKGCHGSGVEQTILSSGPVLEAFGNAKTKHNNNSSRFGKFIQVSYKENGLVQGACFEKYLLEKSRICSQAYNERSYHVFYYLLAGASEHERTQFNLLRPKDYNYLNQSKCYTIEGCDEQFEFLRLKQSMEMVGFSALKQQRMFSILSAVLLLGNVEFQQSRTAYHHHDESVCVRNTETVAAIASLLGVSEAYLTSALTAKKTRVQGETLVIHYRKHEAIIARDTLAKCLYGALFDWIVLQLNYSLLSLKDQSGEKSANSIGVLDIFGFEDFANQNRFEQFCINYANERLQHYFNQHVFEYEQEEYQREGIAWTHIEFQDNVDCLALIEGKPMGLLCTLDDQCNFPGATNETFLQKINSVHKNNPFYEIPVKRESAFIIQHYAGPVKYQINDIREKNLDLMRPELITVLKHSQHCIVRELAGADPVAVFRWAILKAFFRATNAFRKIAKERSGSSHNKGSRKSLPKVTIEPAKIQAAIENNQNRLRRTRYTRTGSGGPLVGRSSRFRSHHGAAGGLGRHHQKNLQTVKALAMRTQGRPTLGSGSRKLPHTVTAQFQMSLQALMETLNRANPYFIRCIKSNANKEANVFDDELVMRQLRYTGMLETVRIRQAGFNVRMTYEEFIQHYRILLPKGLLSSQSDVKRFLTTPSLLLDLTEHQEGNTRIFMRESQKEKLDSLLHQTILERILVIQRWYRAARQRRMFINMRASVLTLQSHVRRWMAEQELARRMLRHRAAVCIQKTWRGFRQRKVYLTVRRAVIGLQCAFRGARARERLKKMREEKLSRASVESTSSMCSDATSSSHSTVASSRSTLTSSHSTSSHSTLAINFPVSSGDQSAEDMAPPSVTDAVLQPRKYSVDPSQLSQSRDVLRPDPKRLNRALSDPYEVTTSSEKQQRGPVMQEPDTRPQMRPLEDIESPPEVGVEESQRSYRSQMSHEESQDSLNDDLCRVYPPSIDRKDLGALLPVGDTIGGNIMPPPRRKSAANILNYEPGVAPPSSLRRQSEQWRGSLPTPSAPLTPTAPQRQKREGSFRHRLYPKVRAVEHEEKEVSASQDTADEGLNSSRLTALRDNTKHHHKFNLKKTIKNVIGSKTVKETVYDDDNSSLSCDSVPATPTLEHSDSITGHLSGSGYDSSVLMEPSGSLPPAPSSQALSQQEIKAIVAASPHSLKQSQLKKGDNCSACAKTFNNFFIKQGYKCVVCRMVFHQRCIELSLSMPCGACGIPDTPPQSSLVAPQCPSEQSSPSLSLKIKRVGPSEQENSWNLTRTSQFIDKSDEVIRDINEMHGLDQFLTKKLFDLRMVKSNESQDKKSDSQVDQLFLSSLRNFKMELVEEYSRALKAEDSNTEISCVKYKDLVNTFERIMTQVTKQTLGISSSSFPVTMGVNAFRGFIDEYIKERNRGGNGGSLGGAGGVNGAGRRRKRNRRKKKEKKPVEDVIHGSHKFANIMINIPTYCEVCNAFLWLSVKALTCNKCKLTCHVKCLPKVEQKCSPSSKLLVISSSTSKQKSSSQPVVVTVNKVFGVPLEQQVLVTGLPMVVEKLLTSIERVGLYVEGIYRKSASTSKRREVKALIEEDVENVDLSEMPVHVLTTLLKSFLRELPEPVLTDDAYDPLLHASLLPDSEEQCNAALSIIARLPTLNFSLVERIFYHLVRVAHQEEYNRMNCNALAIVFTPCLIRASRSLPVQDNLSEVTKHTQVIEKVLNRRLQDFRSTLEQIDTLDSQTADTGAKLDAIRHKREQMKGAATSSPPRADPRLALQEYKLEEQLVTLSEEREILALELRDMYGGASSEEELLTVEEAGVDRSSVLRYPVGRKKDPLTRQMSADSTLRGAPRGDNKLWRLPSTGEIAVENSHQQPDDDDSVMV